MMCELECRMGCGAEVTDWLVRLRNVCFVNNTSIVPVDCVSACVVKTKGVSVILLPEGKSIE